jgi:preprotein translocase subunit SecD
VRRTRGLWVSIIFVAVLVIASLAGFASGKLKPKLGLDLQGGVQVILSAPAGTQKPVMDQTLQNIRNRVDAFGVGESQIFLSSNTITVQIPGGANGTIRQQHKTEYCLIGTGSSSYGCAADKTTAANAVEDLSVQAQPSKVCVNDAAGKQLQCFSTQAEADALKSSITVHPKASATPTASAGATPSASAGPGPTENAGPYCLTDPGGKELACYRSQDAATAAQKGVTTAVTENTYCVMARATEPTPSPSPSANPSGSATPSASPSPTPVPSAFSTLDRKTATALPCDLGTKSAADQALAAIAVKQETVQYCVTSSGGANEGCYLAQTDATQKLKEIGTGRLIDIIGQTARLEERQVLSIVPPTDPSYATTPLTCSTPADDATPACQPDVLDKKNVTYLDEQGNKVNLGPVVITGANIKKATAVLSSGQNQIVTQWVIDFDLDGNGAKVFGDITAKLATLQTGDPTKEIAIAIDRRIISRPEVQGQITTSGQITGNFTEDSSKTLATQLNAGALPVELTRQSVTTVSPTLGQESLRQGIVAGVAGLILLLLYLLFYYRLLGIVAWFGMSIWAILAIGLIAVAGSGFGYALSLAGIAGLVISLGVTADSYIVFFERLKDEVRNGKSPRSAVQPAFKRAYRTIVAADLVTGIAAVVLYVTAVSSVRGFALTLGVATLLDLFVVWFFKRPTVFLISRSERLVKLPGFGLTSGVAGESHDATGVVPGTGVGVDA